MDLHGDVAFIDSQTELLQVASEELPTTMVSREFVAALTDRESWSVQLEPGRHMLAGVAESSVDKGTPEPVEVTFSARELVRTKTAVKSAVFSVKEAWGLSIGRRKTAWIATSPSR